MSSQHKIEANWKEVIAKASGIVARMLASTFDVPRLRHIPVREPSRAEIEHWLRERK